MKPTGMLFIHSNGHKVFCDMEEVATTYLDTVVSCDVMYDQKALDAAVKAERIKCIDVLRNLRDSRQVTNSDYSWLVRVSQEDCIIALKAYDDAN